jgi:RNA polymerase sigma factor (sigma-70 family)
VALISMHDDVGQQEADSTVRVAVSRDRDWLEGAFREHYVPLVRLASMLVDRNVAEEIVQDAFVKTHGKLHRVDPEKVPQYLRAAVINGSRSRLRRREVRRRHASTERGAVRAAELDALAGSERSDMLRQLETLPTRQREVLLLRYYLDLSEHEIAAALGLSVGSVKTHAHRGLAALAARLDNPGRGPDDDPESKDVPR